MYDLISQGGRQQLGQAIIMRGVELRGRTLIYLWEDGKSRPDKTCDHCPKWGSASYFTLPRCRVYVRANLHRQTKPSC